MGDARRLLAAAVAALALVLAGCGGAGEETGGTPPPAPTAGAPIVNGGPLAPLPPEGSREGQRICGKFQSVPVAGGRYEVQNNAWGATTPQCRQIMTETSGDPGCAPCPGACPCGKWPCIWCLTSSTRNLL